jgi:penicillin amidase
MIRRRQRRRGFGFWAKRLGISFAALILLLIGGIAGAIWWSLPARNAEVALAGLSAPVAITLDTRGIPHITASSEEDAWAALGFLHARDRMFQMEMMRRGARGQTAAVAGAAALRLDRFMRLLRLEERATADLAALDAETRAQVTQPSGAQVLVLGPEPLIAAQRLVLQQGDRQLTLATDGLSPFAVVPNP